MATRCGHFAHLCSRYSELCSKFLNDEVRAEIDSPGSFLCDLDKLAAFRLLFHAEVETFLEARAIDQLSLIQTDINKGVWQKQHPSILSLYLLVQNFIQSDNGLTDSELKPHFNKVIGSARAKVKKNNSIKADAFTFLSVAAGKSLDEIDATLLSTLNSYGRDRGDVAHSSVTRVRSLAAPSAEKAVSEDIVDQLAAYFDVTS